MRIPFFNNGNKQEVKEHPNGKAFFLMAGGIFKKNKKTKDYFEEGYMRNVIVYKAIKEITNAISDVDIYVVKRNGDDVEKDREHEAVKLLERPNPMQGKDGFLQELFTNYQVSGEMFCVRTPENGSPVELWALNPMHMEIAPGQGGMPSAYIHKVNNREKKFDVDPRTGVSQVFHLKEYNPLDYWRGLSPLKAASLAADTHNAGLMWNHSLLDNGARPSGIIKFKEDPGIDAMNRLKEHFKNNIQGSSNAGELPVLTDDAEWQQIDNNPRDMDYISTMKETAKYVASALGVPLPLIDNDASTFNNMEQAKERLWTDTVLPLLNKFLIAYSNWLKPIYGEDFELCADLDSIPALEGVRTRTFNRMVEAVKSGLITIDEARQAIGYDSLGGVADSLFVPANSIPIDMAGFDALPPEEKRLAMEMRALGYDDEVIQKALKE
jgi:HK97 family phage portal protein